jgi:hypothetical protein
MPRGPLLFATFGLALNLFLWGVPGMVATAAAAHFALPQTPTLAQALEHADGDRPALTTSLVQLVGAESEALEVAADALRQPTPPELAPRANTAGTHVETALYAYLTAAQKLLNR